MKPFEERMLRLPQVVEISGLSPSTIFRLMKQGQFPPVKQVGPRAARWRLSEIDAWIAGLPGGSNPKPGRV